MSTETNLINFDPTELGSLGTSFISSVQTVNNGDTLSVSLQSGETKEVGDLLPSPARNLTDVEIDEENKLTFVMDNGAHRYVAGDLLIEETINGSFPAGFGALSSDGFLKEFLGGSGISVTENENNFTIVVDDFLNVQSYKNTTNTKGIVSFSKTEYVAKGSTDLIEVKGNEHLIKSNVSLNKGSNLIKVSLAPSNTSYLALTVKDSSSSTLLKSKEFKTIFLGNSPFIELELEMTLTEDKVCDIYIKLDSEESVVFKHTPTSFNANVEVDVVDVQIKHTVKDLSVLSNYVPPEGEVIDFSLQNNYLSNGDDKFDFIQLFDYEILNGYSSLVNHNDKIIALPKNSNYILFLDKLTNEITRVFVPGQYQGYRESSLGDNKIYLYTPSLEYVTQYDLETGVFSESEYKTYSNSTRMFWNNYLKTLMLFHSNNNWYLYDKETQTFNSSSVNQVEVAEGEIISTQEYAKYYKTGKFQIFLNETGFYKLRNYITEKGVERSDFNTLGYNVSSNIENKLVKKLSVLPRVTHNTETNDDELGFAFRSSAPNLSAIPFKPNMTSSFYPPEVNDDIETDPTYLELQKMSEGNMSITGFRMFEDSVNGTYSPFSKIQVRAGIDEQIQPDKFTLVEHSDHWHASEVSYNILNIFENDIPITIQDSFVSNDRETFFTVELDDPTLVKSIGYVTAIGEVSGYKLPDLVKLETSDDNQSWTEVELDIDYVIETKPDQGITIFDTSIEVLGIRLKCDLSSNTSGLSSCLPIFEVDGKLEQLTNLYKAATSSTEVVLEDDTTVKTNSAYNGSYALINIFNGGGNRFAWTYGTSEQKYIEFIFPETRNLKALVLTNRSSTYTNNTMTLEYTVNGTDWIAYEGGLLPCPFVSGNPYFNGIDILPLFLKIDRVYSKENIIDLKVPTVTKFLKFSYSSVFSNLSAISRFNINKSRIEELPVVKSVNRGNYEVRSIPEKGMTIFDTSIEVLGIRLLTPEASSTYGLSSCLPIFEVDGKVEQLTHHMTSAGSTRVELNEGTVVTVTTCYNNSNYPLRNIFNGSASRFLFKSNQGQQYIEFNFPETRELKGLLINKSNGNQSNNTMHLQYTVNGTDWIDYEPNNELPSPLVSGNPYFNNFDLDEFYKNLIPNPKQENTFTFDAPVECNRMVFECFETVGPRRWRVFDIELHSDKENVLELHGKNLIDDTTLPVKEIVLGKQSKEINSLLFNIYDNELLVEDEIFYLISEKGSKVLFFNNNLFSGHYSIDENYELISNEGKGLLYLNQEKNGLFSIDKEGNESKINLGMSEYQYHDSYSYTTDAYCTAEYLEDDKVLVAPGHMEIAYIAEPLKNTLRNVNWPQNSRNDSKKTTLRHKASCKATNGAVYLAPASTVDFMAVLPVGTQANRTQVTNPNDGSVGYLACADSSFIDVAELGFKHPKNISTHYFKNHHLMRNTVSENVNESLVYDTSATEVASFEFDFKKPTKLNGLDIQNGNVEYWKEGGSIESEGFHELTTPKEVKGFRLSPHPGSYKHGLGTCLPIFLEDGEYIPLTTKIVENNYTRFLMADGTEVTGTAPYSGGYQMVHIFNGVLNGYSWRYGSNKGDNITFIFDRMRTIHSIKITKNIPNYNNGTMILEFTDNGTDWYSYEGGDLPCPYVSGHTNQKDVMGYFKYSPSAGKYLSPLTYRVSSSDDGLAWSEITNYIVDKEDIVPNKWLKRINFDSITARYLKVEFDSFSDEVTLNRILPITDDSTFVTDEFNRTIRLEDKSTEHPWSSETLANKFISMVQLSETELLALPYGADHPVIIDTEDLSWKEYKVGIFAEPISPFCHSFKMYDGRNVIIKVDGDAYYLNDDGTTESFPIKFKNYIRDSTLGKDGYRYFLPHDQSNKLLKINMVNLMNSEELYVGGITGSADYNSKILTTDDSMLYIRRYRDINGTFGLVDLKKRTGIYGPQYPRGNYGFNDAVRLSTGDVFLIPRGHIPNSDFFAILKRKDRNDVPIANFEEFIELEG